MTDHAVRASASIWRQSLLILVVCIAWILFWYRDTAIAMVTIWWRSETFAHAFLVVPISLWLIWRRRRALAGIEPRASLLAVIPLFLAGVVWLLGNLAAVNSVTQFALVAMLVLAVVVVLGSRVAWAMAFPLGFLFFAVPIGEFVMPQFVHWTADFTVTALRATGVPVYREGTHFIIPNGSWSVIEACSGIRYLIASLVVGTLYAYLSYRSLTKRLLFICVSIVVPVIANWLRAYMIVMLAYLSDNRIAVGVDHLIYGWLFFGLVVIVMYMIGARWADNPDPSEPIARISDTGGSVRRRPQWLVAMAVLAVIWLPLAWGLAIEGPGHGTLPRLVLSPPSGWQASSADLFGWRPAYSGAMAEYRAVFERQGTPAGIFVGYYRHQDYGHKLISSGNVLVKSRDANWRVTAEGVGNMKIDGHSVTVRRERLKTATGRKLLVWQWYWIDGLLTGNDYVAKAYTAWSRLIGRGDDSAVIAVFTDDDDGAGEARLQDLSRVAAGDVDAMLAAARAGSNSGKP
jgi:exosortase A